jgi:hypothetical protein
MNPSVAFTLLLFAAITRADDLVIWVGASPDKKVSEAVRRIPDPHEPSRLDLVGFTLCICTAEHCIPRPNLRSIIAQHTFPRRIVSELRWSPDSQFLLFTTASSSGHSPWHFNTYVFCPADKSFRDVESVTHTTVGSGDFRFEPPDIAVLTVNVVPAESVREIKLPLGKVAHLMQRLE